MRRFVRASVVVGVILSVLATPMWTQAQGGKNPEQFDRGDRRSREVIHILLCAQKTATARSQGLFGPVDSLGRSGQCVVVGDKNIGVFFQTDTMFAATTRFSAVDLAGQSRFAEPLDTAAILAVARAQRTGLQHGMPAFTAQQRQFSPVVFRFDGDSIEVWLIPTSSIMAGGSLSIGGEVGFVFSPDGRTLVREINESAKYRPVSVAALPATVQIESGEESIPTLTEFLLANILNRAGRTVSIHTRRDTATLTGDPSKAVWLHVGGNR